MRIYELLIQKLVGTILILLGAIFITLSEDNTVSMVLFSIGIYFIINFAISSFSRRLAKKWEQAAE